jgi:TM2 domain-containing membrane protein YozV
MFCSKCGSQLNEGSAFCPRCGAQVAPVVEQVAADVSPKSRLATSLLAIFIGEFGVHRFYVGKIATAAVMLLLGLVPVICVVGIVLIAAASDSEDPPALFWVCLGLMYASGFAVSIWALIDFIIALTGNFKDSQGKPIKKW